MTIYDTPELDAKIVARLLRDAFERDRTGVLALLAEVAPGMTIEALERVLSGEARLFLEVHSGGGQ